MPFRAVASEFVERIHGTGPPERTLLANAEGKAREVARRSQIPAGGAVLGADTGVIIDGRMLGKPADAAMARSMLDRLSGHPHEVTTAICLISAEGEISECDTARVSVRSLPEAARDWYVSLGEWRDRAGGYAIQGSGAALIDRVEGDYTTVVGLPVGRLVSVLAATGLAPWDASD